MNRLTEHFAEITPSLPRTREPLNGELCYAMMCWRARRGANWKPASVDAIPPHTLGRYTIIWSIDREMPPILREVIDYNVESLKYASKKNRVRTWAVLVKAVYGHDETAQIVNATCTIGGGL
jgi:hypothetical protein